MVLSLNSAGIKLYIHLVLPIMQNFNHKISTINSLFEIIFNLVFVHVTLRADLRGPPISGMDNGGSW